MLLPHMVRVSLSVHMPPIGCVGVSTGNGSSLTHHRRFLHHIIHDPNPLKEADEYAKSPLQAYHIGVCNEAVISIKQFRLIHHRVSKAVRYGLVLCHYPNPVAYDRVHHDIEDRGGGGGGGKEPLG